MNWPLTLDYQNWNEDGNLLDLYAAWEEHVHELTISSPSTQLLNLGKLGLKNCQPLLIFSERKRIKLLLKANLNTIVDPGKHVMAGEVLGGPTCGVNIHRHLEHSRHFNT